MLGFVRQVLSAVVPCPSSLRERLELLAVFRQLGTRRCQQACPEPRVANVSARIEWRKSVFETLLACSVAFALGSNLRSLFLEFS